MKKHLKKFGYGILIGLSNLIPGFSGGTMALILGILEEFTDAVSSFTKTPLKAIKELGYVPNHNARSLSTGKSHLIGLFLPLSDTQRGCVSPNW